MRILSLSVQNYRSLVDVSLDIPELTVIIGPNGSGKTALLEVFQLLQQGGQQNLGSFLESLGGFHATLSHPDIAREPWRLGITLKVDGESARSREPINYTLELARKQVGYAIESERLEWRCDPAALQPYQYIRAQGERIGYVDPVTKALVEPTWDYDYSEMALAQVPKMLQEPEALRSMLASTRHYSFLDVGPRSIVRLPQSLTPATRPGPNGENLYSALHNLDASHGDVYEEIESLLAQGFPGFERLKFPSVGAGQVTLNWYDRSSKEPYYPGQLSEGTLRFLWLITILLAPPAPPVTLLDEPEVSLHPELLKLLAAVLQEAGARSQIVAATHSPDLIRWLKPAELLVADKEDGVTRLNRADQLDLDDWLAEYSLRDLWLMGNLGGRP